MLFNTAWNKQKTEVQPQVDIMSTASLIAWLEKQPTDGTYPFNDPYRCLLAQYLHENGKPWAILGQFSFYPDGGWGDHEVLPKAFVKVAAQMPHTFGAALARARAYSQEG